MPAAYAPDLPNITYPCPDGLPVGAMITVGIPCGITLTSVPASRLPTMGGIPAAVDLNKAGVSAVSCALSYTVAHVTCIAQVWPQGIVRCVGGDTVCCHGCCGGSSSSSHSRTSSSTNVCHLVI
jgi:hypothetical protein